MRCFVATDRRYLCANQSTIASHLADRVQCPTYTTYLAALPLLWCAGVGRPDDADRHDQAGAPVPHPNPLMRVGAGAGRQLDLGAQVQPRDGHLPGAAGPRGRRAVRAARLHSRPRAAGARTSGTLRGAGGVRWWRGWGSCCPAPCSCRSARGSTSPMGWPMPLSSPCLTASSVRWRRRCWARCATWPAMPFSTTTRSS